MKAVAWCVSVMLTAVYVPAAQFSDDFNRESTPFVSLGDAVQIGESWKTESPDSSWRILENRVIAKVPATVPKPILYNTNALTKSGDGTGFKLSGTVTLKTDNKTGLAGIVCNYQNSNDQYVFRFGGSGTVQFLRKNSSMAVFSKPDAFKQISGTPYHMTIQCKKPYDFNLTIQNAATGETVFSQDVTDNQKSYADGYGGFYSSCGAATFDDLMFETLTAQ